MNTKTTAYKDLKVGDRFEMTDPSLCKLIEYKVESFDGRKLVLRSYYGALELDITWHVENNTVEVIA